MTDYRDTPDGGKDGPCVKCGKTARLCVDQGKYRGWCFLCCIDARIERSEVPTNPARYPEVKP
jgi:hypothetical protein